MRKYLLEIGTCVFALLTAGTACARGMKPFPLVETGDRVIAPPAGVHPFYKKYINAGGVLIVSSQKVPDAALAAARVTVLFLMSKRPDLQAALVENHPRISIMALSETASDLPEFGPESDGEWGLGQMPGDPASLVSERGVCYPGNPEYRANFLVHEFVHMIHNLALPAVEPGAVEEIYAAYRAAVERGEFKAPVDEPPGGLTPFVAYGDDEYFTTAVNAWYGLDESWPGPWMDVRKGEEGPRSGTRAELESRDPAVAAIVRRYFPDRGEAALTGCARGMSRIAYTKYGESGPEIWVMDADGSGSRRLGPGSGPSWSPDGSKLAFAKTVDGNTDIYFMDAADGDHVTRLTTHPAEDHGPAWSPDGSMIAFNSDRSGSDQIWRTNVEAGSWGYNLTQLTEDTSHHRVNNFISWSPDGLWIAFEADRDRDDPEIYLANAVDGTDQRRLTFTRALDEVPSWSPDGRRILFSSDRHDDPQSGTYDIYIMDADGSNRKRLTITPGAASYPSMSPDGKHIVYTYSLRDDDAAEIWIMNADGSGQRRLLEGGSTPRYSPF